MEPETVQGPAPEKEAKARERAQVILKVRSGKRTATEGAGLLGISRQRFYEWEHRALSAMAEALLDGEAGRPEKPAEDPEKETLKRRVVSLEQELTILRQSATVRDALFPLGEWRNKPKDPEKKRPK
jgi:hypothetical protein